MPFPRCTAGRARASLLAAFLLLPAGAAAQVTVGQTDTFEDGTTQGWGAAIMPGVVHPAPPTNVSTGGPAGADDNFLQITAVGGSGDNPGPGSRLVTINFAGQWAGDYVAAGVNAIQMDAINLGTSDLFLRLVFEDPSVSPPGPPTTIALSASPVLLPAGTGWTRVTLPLYGPDGLVSLFGADVPTLLANTTAIRIISGPAFENPPAPVVGVLGVDNITAAVVPEPATYLLVGSGLLGVLAVARGRRRVA